MVREYSGTVTGDEVFDSIMELTSQDRFADVSYIINDYTNMTELIFDPVYVGAVSAMDKQTAKDKSALKKIAVVAAEQYHPTGLAYKELMADSPMKLRCSTR
ncbi:MAG: hypothetical protein AUK35_06440 [Zetaproteobacteria bacterium CG2_30_46_52]|nr:MAG: hypothetical protein AUK35_06440 [Zetaproteobacteria bacterium CG2_30_46_52]